MGAHGFVEGNPIRISVIGVDEWRNNAILYFRDFCLKIQPNASYTGYCRYCFFEKETRERSSSSSRCARSDTDIGDHLSPVISVIWWVFFDGFFVGKINDPSVPICPFICSSYRHVMRCLPLLVLLLIFRVNIILSVSFFPVIVTEEKYMAVSNSIALMRKGFILIFFIRFCFCYLVFLRNFQ